MVKVKLLPVDIFIFEAINEWCKKYDKTPTDAIDHLFSIDRTKEKTSLLNIYYTVLHKRLRRKQEDGKV